MMLKIPIILFSLTILWSCAPQEVPTTIDIEQVKKELDSIMLLDQQYRNQIMELYKKGEQDSTKLNTLIARQTELDKSNMVYVDKLIQRLGKYPGNSLFGSRTGSVAFFIIQHQPPDVQANYFDLIMEAGQNNELKKGDVALYHDRYLIQKGEPQIYGTQVGILKVIDPVTGMSRDSFFLHPIKDTTKIDSVRLWNGLLPLEDYLNSFGLSRWKE